MSTIRQAHAAQRAAPRVMTANLLRSGDVVYLAEDGRWVRELAAASIAFDAPGREALQRHADAAVAANEVVAAYLMDVRLDAGQPLPASVRETIRALRRPTIDV